MTAGAAVAGLCLLLAPAAHADLDDLLDTVIGAASAAADPVDAVGIPDGSVDLDASGVLQDPLVQLDQLLHGSSGQAEPEPAGTNPDTSADANQGTPADTSGTSTGAEHQSGNSENSNNSTSFPKLSMPSGGSGGSGSGGSGNGGGSGGQAGNRTKSNTSAAKPGADRLKLEGDGIG